MTWTLPIDMTLHYDTTHLTATAPTTNNITTSPCNNAAYFTQHKQAHCVIIAGAYFFQILKYSTRACDQMLMTRRPYLDQTNLHTALPFPYTE